MEQNTFSNSRIQVIAIIVSVTVLVIIFNLIRKKKIKEEYSPDFLILTPKLK
jgi:ABC-type phosphate/phosphonate transport system permease subunit